MLWRTYTKDGPRWLKIKRWVADLAFTLYVLALDIGDLGHTWSRIIEKAKQDLDQLK